MNKAAARSVPWLALAPACIAAAQPCDFAAVDAAASRLLEIHQDLPGLGLLVADRSGVLHETYLGSYGPGTVVPVASASKLLSGVAIMTLVDDGLLDLHAPIATYLTDIFTVRNAGLLKPALTADQMFSMSSGFPNGSASGGFIGDRSLSMREAVEGIAAEIPLVAPPGTTLLYTGYGMHIVGHAAEVLSGIGDYERFFDRAVSEPLALTTIEWDGLGETHNYVIEGGAESSLRDYARVLRMLLRGGELDGARVLSAEAVDSMFVSRTDSLPFIFGAPDAEANGWGYGFGTWVEASAPDGRGLRVTSPGAFGFTPVVDVEDGYAVAVMIRGQQGARDVVLPEMTAVLDAVELAMAAGCRSCPADLDRSGAADGADITAFVAAFLEAAPAAGPDGRVDGADISAFVGSFLSGCP